MATKTFVSDGTAHREAKSIWVSDGTIWRDIKRAWVSDGTAWRLVFVKTINLVISSNTQNYNILTAAQALYGTITTPVNINLTVNSSVIVGSSYTVSGVNQNKVQSVASPAMVSGTFPAGSTLTITVNSGAYIVGAGGQGGSYGTPTSGARGTRWAGGDALSVSLPTTIYNYGTIAGGGGGGAGGDGAGDNSVAGGGGAGYPGGQGGFGYGCGTWGANGTLTVGGNGSCQSIYPAKGGNLGVAGQYGGNFYSTGVVGQPGAYIVGASNVTWAAAGTRLGVAV